MIHSHSKRVRPLGALALAFVLLFSSLSSPAQTVAPAQALKAPPYQWPRSRSYDVEHYQIKLSFDWASESIAGETTIALRPFKSDVSEIELDAGEMTINSVKTADGSSLKFRYENKQKLVIQLDKSYPANADLKISISYAAAPKKGLIFVKPTKEDPTRPFQIWSQGQSEYNHYWFPCYDFPNDKATTELIATVDEQYQVISNGTLISNNHDPAKKTRTYHWKMDQPYSSYLVSIIVGQFAEIRDQVKNVPVVSYVYQNKFKEAQLSFAQTAEMVGFFSARLAFDYPYPKYAQTTVRDFGGGMENMTATTLADTSVFDERALLDVSAEGLVAHELAHSWFGNLLTCRDWGEIWLNESFATFMDAAWTEHDRGRDDYLYQMHGNQQAYFQSWAQGYRRPIVTKRFPDPDSVFDTYAYPRGGAVINTLRFVLGEELFWKAINHYLKKHQFQNVETQQLVVAIEEATGQNLQWFFDQWIYKMGHPEFEITSRYDNGAKALKLSVKQTQKRDEARPWFESPESFIAPVDVAITTAAGERVHRVMIDSREEDFSFPVESKPLIVNFDRGNYTIKEVKFNRSDEEIAYQLLHDRDAMGRVRAAIELRQKRSDAAAKALGEAALKDSFWAVRVESTRSLGEIKNDRSRQALLEAVKDKDSRIRREAIRGLSAFKDAKLADLFISIINTDQSYFAIAEAAGALGGTASPRAYDALLAALDMDSWQETVRAGALDGLASLKDTRALDIGMKFAAPGNPARLRASAFNLIAALGKGNNQALELLLAAIKEQSLQMRFTAMQALGTLGDARAIPALEQMAKEADLPEFVRNQIAMVIAGIKTPKKQEGKN